MTDIKILFFAASFPPPLVGGSVSYVYNIVSHLRDFSVVVHTANAEPQQAPIFDQALNQRVIRSRLISHVVEGYKLSGLRLILARLKEYLLWPLVAFWLIIRERPQVVHLGEYNLAGIAAWLAARFLGIPYCLYTYAEEIPILSQRPWHNIIFKKLLRDAAAVITVSDYSRNLLVELGVAPERIIKILPAVGSEKLSCTPMEIIRVRQKFGLENCQVLLTVGSLTERKGHETVIEALPFIQKSHPGIRYVIVGYGPREVTLRQKVRELGLQEQVVFTGRADDKDLACLYDICDIFVMPHRQIPGTLDTEGCPTVFLEAGAHGKPVIGGNAGGVADAILHDHTGLIIDGTDAVALAQAVDRLLDDPELARRLGENGRRYTATLTPERNAAMVWQLCEELLGKGPRQRRCPGEKKPAGAGGFAPWDEPTKE